MKEFIEKISYYDVLEIRREGKFDELPTFSYEDDSILINMKMIPKKVEKIEIDSCTIGMYPFETRWGDSREEALQASIKRKALRYEKLEYPYVLAINNLSIWSDDERDPINALFGSEKMNYNTKSQEERYYRVSDGIWNGPKGPQCTRLSSLLVTKVWPSNLANAKLNKGYFKPLKG